MENGNFKVSLIISTYNWKEALRGTLKSVFNQSVLPYEIVIADDGSGEDTRLMVEQMSKDRPVNIKYIWHKDDGFRLSVIRNKAIAAAEGDYIIQIDGDIILEKHFIEDHIYIAERGCFVCGSRVKLNDKTSKIILKGEDIGMFKLIVDNRCFLNSFRNRFIMRFLSTRYHTDKLDSHLRGCNMAYWREDFIAVNGYDENMTGWGSEDIDIALRLSFAGIRKKALKFGGVVYHINHKENSKERLGENNRIFNSRVKSGEFFVANGIDKHIKKGAF